MTASACVVARSGTRAAHARTPIVSSLLPPSQPAASPRSQAGFRTGFVGKVHLGGGLYRAGVGGCDDTARLGAACTTRDDERNVPPGYERCLPPELKWRREYPALQLHAQTSSPAPDLQPTAPSNPRA